jgi:hypothetical protein
MSPEKAGAVGVADRNVPGEPPRSASNSDSKGFELIGNEERAMALKTVTWKQLQRTLRSKIERTHVVLDIGCGIQPQKLVVANVHICVEPFREYADHLLNARHDRDYVVLNCGWEKAIQVLAPGSVDSVFLVDVVEHLEKQEGQKLLKQTLPLVRRQVVVITPYGFMPQHHEDGKDIWGLSGGCWQEHRSGWDERDFDDRWQLFVVPDHYKTDNQGNPLTPPNGYMLAILNLDGQRFEIHGARMLLIDWINGAYQRLLGLYRWAREELRRS